MHASINTGEPDLGHSLTRAEAVAERGGKSENVAYCHYGLTWQ